MRSTSIRWMYTLLGVGLLWYPWGDVFADAEQQGRSRRWQRIQLHPQTTIPEHKAPLRLDCANPAKLPFVEIRINGVPGWFVLDTGASHTIVCPNFADKSGLADTRFYHPVEGNVHGRRGTFYRVASLDFANANYRDFHVLGLPLNHLQEALSRQVDGILGANVLLRHPFMLDVRGRIFQFIDSSEFDVLPWVPHQMDTGRVALEVDLGHSRLPMVVDSGATRSMILSSDWNGKRLFREGEMLVDINRASSPGTDEYAGNGRFCIGTVCVEGIEFKLSDSRLLGIDLLERHILRVDPIRRRTVLTAHPTNSDVLTP